MRIKYATLFLGLASCWSVCGLAQNAVSTGSMSGVVRDPGGQVVVHASVVAVDEATGEKASSVTNDSGIFNFPVLKVGIYDVSFSSAGFKTARIKGLIVGVGHMTDTGASLSIGEVSETVVVDAGDASTLNPTDTTVGTLVQQGTLQGLPISGRRYTDLVLLTPNVTTDGEYGHITFAGQPGGQLSGYSNTASSSSNANGSSSFSVDGADSTSYYTGDSRGNTRLPFLFGMQSIQEFQVQSNVYNAAYGGAGAGFINTVTKSGTNTWHGDAYYYNRNSGTGTNDAIDKAAGNPKPVNVLQQFGADIGGPIRKDKMFFYFDYEQQRQKDPLYSVNTAQAATTEANFNVPVGTPLPTPNSHYPTAASISEAGAQASGYTSPIYLQGVANALNVIHSNLGPRARRRDEYEFFPKLDWQISSKDRISALYNYVHFQTPGGIITYSPESFAGDESLGNNGVRDHVGTIHWTHTFGPSLLNDAYVSYVRDEQIQAPSGLAPSSTTPQMILTAPSTLFLGNPVFAYGDEREYQWQFADHLTYILGKHQLDMGYNLNHEAIATNQPGNFYGQYIFTSLEDFALGKWDIFQQTAGNPKFDFSAPFMGFYVNDTWRATQKLTLTGGLREDFEIYANPAGNPALPFTQVFHNQYQRVSPRLGFSYAPFSKTVVRGGIGMYYELFEGANYQNSTQANGVSQTNLSLTDFSSSTIAANQTPSFPGALPGSNSNFAGGTNIATIASNFKTPSVISSSLQIDQEIAPHTILSVGSLWSHGMHITASTAYDLNQKQATGTTTYVLPSGQTVVDPNLDSHFLQEGLISSNFGQINALISPGINNYNSVFVELNRQMSHGVSVIMSYTLSKSTQSGVDFYNQFDMGETRGLSLLDQRHRLSVAAVYAPDVSFENHFEQAVLKDWKVSLLSQFNSGRPYTGVIGTGTYQACTTGYTLNAAGNLCTNTTTSATETPTPSTGGSLNDSAALQSTPNTAAGLLGGGSPGYGLAPGDGMNTFVGPWITEIDLGIERGFHVTEKQTIVLKAQVFNLFNTADYFVEAGNGINQVQYIANGPTCGDGMTLNQTCTLTPNNGPGGFGTRTAISQSNPGRIMQFSFAYKF
jgi:hypothetical protein